MKHIQILTFLIITLVSSSLMSQESPSKIGKPMPEPGKKQANRQQSMTPEEWKQRQIEAIENNISHVKKEMGDLVTEENMVAFEEILSVHFVEEFKIRLDMMKARSQAAAGPEARQAGMAQFREQREALLDTTSEKVTALLGKKGNKKFKKIMEAMAPQRRPGGRPGGGGGGGFGDDGGGGGGGGGGFGGGGGGGGGGDGDGY